MVEGYKPQDFSFFHRGWKISTTWGVEAEASDETCEELSRRGAVGAGV